MWWEGLFYIGSSGKGLPHFIFELRTARWNGVRRANKHLRKEKIRSDQGANEEARVVRTYLGESGVYIRSQRGRKEPEYVELIAYGKEFGYTLSTMGSYWKILKALDRTALPLKMFSLATYAPLSHTHIPTTLHTLFPPEGQRCHISGFIPVSLAHGWFSIKLFAWGNE